MKNRRDDDGCCSRIFLKSIMVVFNTFFWLSGVAFLFIGMASLLLRHDYIALLDSELFPITTYLFIAIGGIILIVGAIGCLGTLREWRCCLVFYAFVLMAIFMLETCVGVLAYMYENAIHEELTRNLNATMTNKYGFDEDVTRAVDDLQKYFHCCGTERYTDWEFSKWALNTTDVNLVPPSCCISPNVTCADNVHASNIYHQGCMDELEKFLRLHLILIGGVGLGLSILQLFGIIFSCCLAQRVKDQDDY